MSVEHLIDFHDSIAKKLLESEVKYSNKIAIQFKEQVYTYRTLFEKAKALAMLLKASSQSRCLILTDRTPTAYIAFLAVLLSGKAYVFLNRKDIINQLDKAILLTDSNLIISDEQNLVTLNKLSHQLDCVCLNDSGEVRQLSNIFHSLKNGQEQHYNPPASVYKYVYLMFTSGSTAEPKGVPISNENLNAFLHNILKRIKPTEQDKFAHINELTFDFSVFEIFSCWLSGACLCVLPDNYIIGIDNYIKKNQITIWSCVPSFVNVLKNLKKLNEGSFNSIRYSIFCGEALTSEIATLWNKAAPNSVIDNLYGPTEATVAITGYIWDGKQNSGVLPIGFPFNNQKIYLLNTNNEEVASGEIGEICLSGSQVADKYWNNEAITLSRFAIFKGQRLYKTGDLACIEDNKGFCYKGRIDDQLKLKGYRVEKLDIENRIKDILNTQSVAIVVLSNDTFEMTPFLKCFFSDVELEVAEVIKLCRQLLPDFMVPASFIKLNQFPYNKNGKIDYPFLFHLASSK